MPAPEQPRFNLRLTPDLQAELLRAKDASGRSMNGEILDRLARSFDPDPALQIAETLRPFLSKLDERQQQEAVRAISDLVALSALSNSKRKRPNSK